MQKSTKLFQLMHEHAEFTQEVFILTFKIIFS